MKTLLITLTTGIFFLTSTAYALTNNQCVSVMESIETVKEHLISLEQQYRDVGFRFEYRVPSKCIDNEINRLRDRADHLEEYIDRLKGDDNGST